MRKVGALFGTVATVVIVALQAKAAFADSLPPTIDLKARCRTSEKAMIEMMGDSTLRGTAFDTCMKSEKEAQAAIAKAWTDMPPSYKSFCIRKNDFSPSYIEWITCLEMMMDLKKLRASTGAQPDYVSRLCPKIKYAPDGSIKRVQACSL